MAKEKRTFLPGVQRLLKTLGDNIRLARLRRRLPAQLIAQRANISRNTLRSIEHGEPTVSLGAYASVLLSLGLENDLSGVAKDDIVGRKLQDANLFIKPNTKRLPRRVSKLKKSNE